MFDLSYPIPLNPISKTTKSNNGENKAIIYKVKCSGIPYHIRFEYFDHNICFVKFYIGKNQDHPFKYQERRYKEGKTKNLIKVNRLLSAIIDLIIKEKNKNEDLIFGFYGQWDAYDIKRNRELSQRFSTYYQVMISKRIDKAFSCYIFKKINSAVFLPLHIDRSDKLNFVINYLTEKFGNSLEELVIPSLLEELKTLERS